MILFYFAFSQLEVRQNNVAKEKKNVKFMPKKCEKKCESQGYPLL